MIGLTPWLYTNDCFALQDMASKDSSLRNSVWISACLSGGSKLERTNAILRLNELLCCEVQTVQTSYVSVSILWRSCVWRTWIQQSANAPGSLVHFKYSNSLTGKTRLLLETLVPFTRLSPRFATLWHAYAETSAYDRPLRAGDMILCDPLHTQAFAPDAAPKPCFSSWQVWFQYVMSDAKHGPCS